MLDLKRKKKRKIL